MDLVTTHELERLFQHFTTTAYRATENSPLIDAVQNNCEALFAKDYKYSIINNANGELAATYPSRIILVEGEKNADVLDVCDRIYRKYDAAKIKNLITKARGARCRTRFPVPAIFFEGKNICRSATISCRKEALARKVMDYLGSPFQGASEQREQSNSDDSSQQFGSVRDGHMNDIRLLEQFSVSYISDLMVEKAKVKFGVYISSSEKVEEEIYKDFKILCLPYPGVEFFNEYRCKNYNPEGLMFNWTEDYVDSVLILPSDTLVHFSNLGIDFHEYKNWDLVKLTQNYIKVLLKYIVEGTSGILIHCISGWDRTPLFISLLRLSLWADGKVHSSLSPLEILYLTVCYDWYLFGHDLPDRLKNGWEVLFFCFGFLKYLSSEEFSICKKKEKKHSLDFHLDLFREETYQGLSSKSSSLSNVSQDSLPPMCFNVQSRESSPCDNGNIPQRKDSLITVSDHFALESNLNKQAFNYTNHSSVPVPVPTRDRSESISSLGCGSWQIISGSGSVKGSESSKASVSLSSPTAEVNQNSHPSVTKCLREEKLEHVRILFHKVYTNILGEKYGNPAETGTFSTFYQFAAEKVGIAAKTP